MLKIFLYGFLKKSKDLFDCFLKRLFQKLFQRFQQRLLWKFLKESFQKIFKISSVISLETSPEIVRGIIFRKSNTFNKHFSRDSFGNMYHQKSLQIFPKNSFEGFKKNLQELIWMFTKNHFRNFPQYSLRNLTRIKSCMIAKFLQNFN